jgi:serine protease Do
MPRRAPLAIAAVLTALLSASAAHAAPPPEGRSEGRVEADGLRKGIVQVEHGGRPLAVGTVLSKDGRVLTSLSALGGAAEPEVRYADGSLVKTKIGHKDAGWDLALLIPQTGRWLEGLVPASEDPGSSEVRTFLPKAGKLAEASVGLKGRTDASSKEGEPLKSVFDVDLKGGPSVPGAPILDTHGKVVAVLVRACKAKSENARSCAPLVIGAPVYALRGFLMKTPATATLPAPWLGLGGAPNDAGSFKGVKVMGIAPGSPAEKAGLKAGDAGDMIVAVNGQPVETPEQLAEVIAKQAIGQTVKLLVFGGGKLREAPVVLKPQP